MMFLLVSFFGTAQTDPPQKELITDRPDETEAPNLISKGFLQVETGAFYKDFESGAFREELFGYNTTLLRYGLLENLELRLGWDYVKRINEINGSEISTKYGFEPLLVGAKIGIAEEKGLLPQIGFMGHLFLPFSAAKEYRPETTGVAFRFAFSNKISENSDLSYNIGAKWKDDSPEAIYIYTIAYGYDLTNKLGVYIEIYGDLPEKSGTDHYWDGGFTYLLSNNVQLDVLAGTGFNNEQNLFIGGGVSFRVPK